MAQSFREPSEAVFLQGGGRMGEAIRAHDWSATPLGSPQDWPSPLRTAVGLMLGASQPVYVAYGPELTSLYNDGYLPIVGEKHPEGLGAPYATLWAEIWDDFKPIVEATMAGEAQHFVNLPIALAGRPGRQVGYFTFSYTALRDDDGQAVGFYCAATETTEEVQQAQRMAENEVLLEQALSKGRGIGTWDWDVPNDRVFADQRFASLYGVDPERARTGAPIGEFFAGVHPADVERLQAGVAEGLKTGGAFSEEYRLLQSDGSSSWVVAEGRCHLAPDGKPLRFLGISFDITDQKAAAVRRDALAAVADAIRDIDAPDELVSAACGILGRALDTSRVAYGTVDPDTEILTVTRDWRAPGVDAVATVLNLRNFGDFVDDLLRGDFTVVRDVNADPRTAAAAEALGTRGVGALAAAPVLEQGRLAAMLYVVHAKPRDWTGGELDLVRDVAARLRTAVERLRGALDLRRLNADLEQQVIARSSERGTTWTVSPYLHSVIDLETGRFTRINPAWTAALGWTEAELTSATFADFLHPDDMDASTAAFAQVRQGRPVLDFQNRYRAKSGEHRWLSWVAVPEGGKLYSTTRDVTEELAAKAERERIFELSPDLIGVATFDGYLKSINPAWSAALGRSDSELLSRPFSEIIHPDDLALTADVVTRLQGGEPVHQFHVRLVKADGEAIPYAWTATPGAAPGNGAFYTVGRDISADLARGDELRLAQEALRQSQKLEAIGQLTGGVAHDFNNLLTVIRGSIDMLRRPSLTDARRDRYVDAIGDASDRAAKLTGQLLAFARRQTLRPETFDVRDSLEAVLEVVRSLTGSRIVVALSVPGAPCWVRADRNQFDTAIVNIAVNARDAMGGEGRIEIAVSTAEGIPAVGGHLAVDGDFIAVTIADAGPGIDPADLPKIFDPFFTTKEVGAGTGLGLSQVIGFAKQSEGEVRAENSSGGGATFTLYLPSVAAPVASVTREAGAEGGPSGAGVCVLLVEDNPQVGEFATHALNELGYDSVLASTGSEALARLSEDRGRFHVVFSDVVMPGMSGLELSAEIGRLYPDVPVILSSGYSHVLAERDSNDIDLLPKPYSIEQLSAAITSALAGAQRG